MVEFFFSVPEFRSFDPRPVREVLRNNLAGVIFRRHASAEACTELYRSFREHEGLRRRTGDATGSYLGTFHWGKPLREYALDSAAFAEAAASYVALPAAAAWRDALGAIEDLFTLHREVFRPAQIDDSPVAWPLVREWEGDGEFSLVPHDDVAQCSDPQQVGFEAQSVASHTPCSINLCIENEGGGELIIWDFSPTEDERRALGVEATGGPYNLHEMGQAASLKVRIDPGDLYIFNGRLVHAVAATHGKRATVSALCGYSSEREVLIWT